METGGGEGRGIGLGLGLGLRLHIDLGEHRHAPYRRLGVKAGRSKERVKP